MKRSLAMLLAVLMCFSLAPMAALADEAFPAEEAAAGELPAVSEASEAEPAVEEETSPEEESAAAEEPSPEEEPAGEDSPVDAPAAEEGAETEDMCDAEAEDAEEQSADLEQTGEETVPEASDEILLDGEAEDEEEKPVWAEMDVSSGVLQEGGLFEDRGRKSRSAGNTDELFSLLYAAAANWDGESDSIEVNVSSVAFPSDSFNDAWKQFLNTNPDLFYVQSEGTYWYINSANVVTRVIMSMNNAQYDLNMVAAFHAKTAEILSSVESGWTEEQKALYLHDYLVTHCEYDKSLQKRSAYDALVTGSSVCQGYALAYRYLLSQCGMDCIIVTSAALNHAWNLVTVDGVPYYVDCTWDDPSNRYQDYCEHENFLRSRDGMTSTDHTADDWVDEDYNVYYGVDAGTEYDSCWWSDSVSVIPHVGNKWAYVLQSDLSVWIHDYSVGTDSKLFKLMNDAWPVWGESSTGYYTGFAHLAALGRSFYASTAEGIYRFTADGACEQIYSLNDDQLSQGYIYGIRVEGSTLYYRLYTSFTPETFVAEYSLTHVWGGYVEWSWEEVFDEDEMLVGYSGASATFTCIDCGETLTLDAVLTTTDLGDGDILYTATVLLDGEEYSSEAPDYGHEHLYSAEVLFSENELSVGDTVQLDLRCEYCRSTKEGVVGVVADILEVASPTCNACGEQLLTAATEYGDVEVEAVIDPDPDAHEWDEGTPVEGGTLYVCGLCGEERLEPAEEIVVRAYGCSLSLEGDIAINFMLVIPAEVFADPGAYVTLNDDTTLPIAGAKIVVKDGITMYEFKYRVAAKEMGKDVVLRAFDGDGELLPLHRYSTDKDLTETGYHYSVQRYIRLAQESSTDAELIALMKAMSDYGSKAQMLFGYDTEHAADIYNPEAIDEVTLDDLKPYKRKITKTDREGVAFDSANLTLESVTTARLFFKVKAGTIDDYSFTVNDEAVEPVARSEGYAIELKNIAAKDLDRMYKVEVSDAEGVCLTVWYSALSYAYLVLNTPSAKTALVETVKALYRYNQAAKTYFN